MSRCVCLGDSIVQGLHGEAIQHAEADRWPTALARALPATVFNRGVGGDTTAMALDRFQVQVRPLLPATVLIAFGINDSYVLPWRRGPRVGLEEFRRNLVELGSWTVRLGGDPVLVVPHRLAERGHNQGNGASLSENLAPYAEMIRVVADECGWAAVDMRAAVAEAHLDSDGVHLSPTGSRAYGETVAVSLASLAR